MRRKSRASLLLGAVSDDEDFQATSQPAAFGPIGVPPMMMEGLPIDAARLLEPTDEIPPIVSNPLQKGSGGITRIKEHLLRATVQAITGRTEEREGQLVLRGATFPLQAHAQWNPEGPIRPNQ